MAIVYYVNVESRLEELGNSPNLTDNRNRKTENEIGVYKMGKYDTYIIRT